MSGDTLVDSARRATAPAAVALPCFPNRFGVVQDLFFRPRAQKVSVDTFMSVVSVEVFCSPNVFCIVSVVHCIIIPGVSALRS